MNSKNEIILIQICAVLILIIIFSIGYYTGFFFGTIIQENILITQLMIRDLNITACHNLNGTISISNLKTQKPPK